ncbi:MAG: gamma-glutamylcyclotransferase, partial [Actinomycetota bacterium]|nr:gamma-glutamylcyclotransferase [Actinomycetota bacterium]
TTTGVAAAWAAGLRVVDDQRPAVLVAAGGRTEQHAVWMAAPEQFASLDRVEGRVADPQRYRLARLRTGTVRTEDGGIVDGAYAYLGLDRIRHPLLVDGAPVFCADVDQAAAKALVGEPAPEDGLDAETVDGVPHPTAWPPRVFVYGLLMPGQPSWGRMAPHAAGEPRPAILPGTVSDTGLGYPALTRDGSAGDVPGYVAELADPVAALPGLDVYEGPEYRRVRVVLGDGTVCWTYLWIETSVPLTPLPHGWR